MQTVDTPMDLLIIVANRGTASHSMTLTIHISLYQRTSCTTSLNLIIWLVPTADSWSTTSGCGEPEVGRITLNTYSPPVFFIRPDCTISPATKDFFLFRIAKICWTLAEPFGKEEKLIIQWCHGSIEGGNTADTILNQLCQNSHWYGFTLSIPHTGTSLHSYIHC